MYEKPILSKLKVYFPELVIYDFDTQSDRLVAGYAMELLEKADSVVVMIEVNEGPATGLISFLEKVIGCKNKCMVQLYGHNPLAERMLKLIDKDKLKHGDIDDDFLQQAIQFLSVGKP